MSNRLSALLSGLLLALTLSACVASTAAGGSRVRTDLLTAEEVQSVGATNLYDLIQQLRPRWLTVRSAQSFGMGASTREVVVFQDQTLLGGIEALRQVTPDMVQSIRYLDGPTASATLPGLGTRAVEGAIVIQLNRAAAP